MTVVICSKAKDHCPLDTFCHYISKLSMGSQNYQWDESTTNVNILSKDNKIERNKKAYAPKYEQMVYVCEHNR